jgi:mannose-6-phosphate isomerase-like protein (cupin superfamily)
MRGAGVTAARENTMTFTLTEAHFTTEDEARAEIEARGWQPRVVDIEVIDNDLHWHDFDAVIYVLDGTARVVLEDGTVMQCGAGARVETPAGVLHREEGTGYRAMIGLAVDPAEMTRPINKPPESRA